MNFQVGQEVVLVDGDKDHLAVIESIGRNSIYYTYKTGMSKNLTFSRNYSDFQAKLSTTTLEELKAELL